ncbi:MAG: hypothetical protein LBB88_02170, partial [Planctomycetaceae bacterium]|jgi:hypothetical protein|nr:hypothetical protein [Planctomycetaceae bacterium]
LLSFLQGCHRKKETPSTPLANATPHNTTTYKSKNVRELDSQRNDKSDEYQASKSLSYENSFPHPQVAYSHEPHPPNYVVQTEY